MRSKKSVKCRTIDMVGKKIHKSLARQIKKLQKELQMKSNKKFGKGKVRITESYASKVLADRFRNRKGFVGKLILPIFLFTLIISIMTFFLMFAQEGVGNEVMDVVANQTNLVAAKVLNDPTAVINNTNKLREDYNSAKFNYDWVFMMAFIFFELSIISLSINSPKLPSWNYLSWLFFGSTMLTFGFSWILDTIYWFINNFIYGGFFDTAVTYLPLYSWFLEYQLIIFVFNFAMALVLNQMFGKQGIIDTTGILGGTQ